MASVLSDIGTAYYKLKRFDVAEKYFNEAKELAEEINNRKLISQALTGTGQLKKITGDFQTSLDLIEESLKVGIDVDNQWDIADAYLSFGNTYNAMGEYKTSIHYYLLTDSIYQLISNEYSRATPINNIGTIYY